MLRSSAKFTPQQAAITLIQGIGLGIAEIIPGVSGSTLALLMGIYDDFIDLLYQGSELVKIIALFFLGKTKFSDIKKQWFSIRWGFGIFLMIGMLGAIIALSNVITWLLAEYPSFLFAFLMGLTPPTIAIVWKQIKKPTATTAWITVVTALILLSIFIIGGDHIKTASPHPAHIFLGGVVSVSTMVLPGVSGSFMLLALGLYNFAVGLISRLSSNELSSADVTSLLTLLAGMATGFLTTVRLLKYAFITFRDKLMAFILGLLLASWYVLWPYVKVTGFEHGEPILTKVWPTQFNLLHSLSLVLIVIVTAVVVYFLQSWADRHDTTPHKEDGSISAL